MTLSESVLMRTNSPLLLLSTSSNSFNTCMLPVIPHSRSRNFSRLSTSRFKTKWPAKVCKDWFGSSTWRYLPNLNDDFSYCRSFKSARELEHDVSDRTPVKNDSMSETPLSLDIPALPGLLKFMLFFGFFTLQESQQAVAVPDIASGLQSFPFFGDLGDISTGFASAFLLIFFSELGDKTFFIAALLAARNSAVIVFIGTFGALAAMTIVSAVLGRTFHYIDDLLPFRFGDTELPVDDIAAVCLLVYFGVSTLLDAASSDGIKAEEEQKEAELAVSEFSGNGAGIIAAAGTIISTFLLVFVAEWGDKSFFSTIALAAASSPLGVIGGALAGHGVATLLAVLGGSLLGTFLSE
ncbi:Gdt1 family, partial [Dillenia turbinata]